MTQMNADYSHPCRAAVIELARRINESLIRLLARPTICQVVLRRNFLGKKGMENRTGTREFAETLRDLRPRGGPIQQKPAAEVGARLSGQPLGDGRPEYRPKRTESEKDWATAHEPQNRARGSAEGARGEAKEPQE